MQIAFAVVVMEMSGNNIIEYQIQLIASGGVSSIADVQALKEMDLHGAIIGKAYYTGAIDLREALEVCR